jgi:hypothetical protein
MCKLYPKPSCVRDLKQSFLTGIPRCRSFCCFYFRLHCRRRFGCWD